MREDDHASWIGICLYWSVIYLFAILFGAIAEAGADFMNTMALGFAGGDLSVTWRNVPVLFFGVLVFSIILTLALLAGEKFLREPIESVPRWFKAFTLAFVFVGSHIAYEVIKLAHSPHLPK